MSLALALTIHNKRKKKIGQHCGDIEIAGYLANGSDPVSFVVDPRLAHERWGRSADSNPNDNLHYPNDKDRSLNETVGNKIRKYRGDCNNRSPNEISFIPPIPSTSGRLHSEFVLLLFLQTHRETDRFFPASGVQFP